MAAQAGIESDLSDRPLAQASDVESSGDGNPVSALSVGLSFKFEVLSALRLAWGFSSAGRAPALQAGGHRFDPDKLHHLWWFGRPCLVAFAIRGAKLLGGPFGKRYPLEKYTNCMCLRARACSDTS